MTTQDYIDKINEFKALSLPGNMVRKIDDKVTFVVGPAGMGKVNNLKELRFEKFVTCTNQTAPENFMRFIISDVLTGGTIVFDGIDDCRPEIPQYIFDLLNDPKSSPDFRIIAVVTCNHY